MALEDTREQVKVTSYPDPFIRTDHRMWSRLIGGFVDDLLYQWPDVELETIRIRHDDQGYIYVYGRRGPLIPVAAVVAPSYVPCPHCDQLPGRPHTEYCCTQPGRRGECPHQAPCDAAGNCVDCGTTQAAEHTPDCIWYPPGGYIAADPWATTEPTKPTGPVCAYPEHSYGRDCGHVDCPVHGIVDSEARICHHHPSACMHTFEDACTDECENTQRALDALPPIAATEWVDDGCRCTNPEGNGHNTACPTQPHPYVEATDDNGDPMPSVCDRCGANPDDPRHTTMLDDLQAGDGDAVG